MFDSLFPKEWTTLQRLMWLKTNALARAVYETITGNPVSFTARNAPLKQLKVAFSPKQDLHGYDSPWPAGGGANKWDEEWEAGYYRTADGEWADASNQICTKNFIAVSPSTTYKQVSSASMQIFYYDANKEYLSYRNWQEGTFTTPSNCYYVKANFGGSYGPTYNHDIALNYPSSVTTYSPYSNLCPILGWDSLNVEQRGKNLYDEEWESGSYSLNTGDKATNENTSRCKKRIPVKPNTQFHCVNNASANKSNTIAVFYGADGTFLTGVDGARNYLTIGNSTFTTPANAYYMAFYTVSKDIGGKVSINYPATDTAYHPYNPSSRSISITLGQTIYSGVLDVVTGQGGDSGSKISFAPNQISTWFDQDAARDTLGFYLQANEFNARYPAPLNANALFEEYKTQSVYNKDIPWIANFVFVSGNFNRFEARVPKSVLAPFSTYAESQAAVLAYLAEHPIVMWYEKSEPLTIQLTPQEVQSLAGDNTMWTDAASLEVTYRSN